MNGPEDTGGFVEAFRDGLILGVVVIRELEVGRLEVEFDLWIEFRTHVEPPFTHLSVGIRTCR